MMAINIDDAKKRVLLLGAVAILALAADCVFIFFPLVGKAYSLRYRICSSRKDITLLNQQLSAVEAVKKRLTNLKEEREKYANCFSKEEEIPAILGDISTIAGRLGVDIIAVKPVKLTSQEGAGKTGDLFHKVPVEIFGKGGYHQIGQFIGRLEAFDKFMAIEDLEITADPASPRKHFFRLMVAAYILKV